MLTIEAKFKIDDKQVEYLKSCFLMMQTLNGIYEGFEITSETTFDEFLLFIVLEGGYKKIETFGETVQLEGAA